MKQKCYTVERIKRSKTPRQVREYIQRQAWYKSFKDLVVTDAGFRFLEEILGIRITKQ